MNWDWNQSLSVMAILLAGGSIWEAMRIKKHFHLDDLTPTRKWKKAFVGTRRTPSNRPDRIPIGAAKDDVLFYRDFAGAVDFQNEIYAETPWSFEDAGELYGGAGSEFGAERNIEIWYNQVKSAWVRLSCFRYSKGDEGLDVRINLEPINARMFEGNEISGLASTIAELVINSQEDRLRATDKIQSTMINNMWQLGHGSPGNPPIEFRFSGKPGKWYLSRQRAKRQK